MGVLVRGYTEQYYSLRGSIEKLLVLQGIIIDDDFYDKVEIMTSEILDGIYNDFGTGIGGTTVTMGGFTSSSREISNALLVLSRAIDDLSPK